MPKADKYHFSHEYIFVFKKERPKKTRRKGN